MYEPRVAIAAEWRARGWNVGIATGEGDAARAAVEGQHDLRRAAVTMFDDHNGERRENTPSKTTTPIPTN